MEINTGFIIIQIVLFILMFMMSLNKHIRWRFQSQIELILVFIVIGVFVYNGFENGLLKGLITIPIAVFIYGILATILVKYLLFDLLGLSRTIRDIRSREQWLRDANRDVDNIFKGKETRSEIKERKLLNRILKKKSINEVLNKNGKTGDDLMNYYSFLKTTHMGWMAVDIISNPKLLDLLFQMNMEDLNKGETESMFLSMLK